MSNITPTTTPGGMVAQTAADWQAAVDSEWTRMFDPVGAVDSVDRIITQKGSDETPERHTRKAYERDLLYFLNWAGERMEWKSVRKMGLYVFIRRYPTHRFPSAGLIQEYIAYQKRRGLKTSTIDRYLAPVGHYVKALTKQTIMATGADFQLVYQFKEWMRDALDENVGSSGRTSRDGALYEHGTRLEVGQVQRLFNHMAGLDDVLGMRDFAMIYLAYLTGMRDAEIRRLRLNHISMGQAHYEINGLRRKRNNYSMIPLDVIAVNLIEAYVAAYNDGLDEDDVRRITDDMPVFQPLRRGGNYAVVGVNRYDPLRGMGRSGFRDVVNRRTVEVLGFKIGPHDLRRTIAKQLKDNKVDIMGIQDILGHSSPATTAGYIGKSRNMSGSLISNLIEFEFLRAG